ncbi:MAG: hypothetical protein V1682_07730 [Candidatus Omnitrophota bacterium]
MVEINLLPQELKPKQSLFSGIDFKGLDINNIPILKIAAGIGIGLVLLQLAVSLIGMISTAQFASATRKYEGISPEKKIADALKAKVAQINKRSGAIDELIAKRVSWARKINLLSDCVIPGIWLSELYYDETSTAEKTNAVKIEALMINGYASGAGEQGAALIGKFIKSLQENSDFYADMASVNLVSTKSEKFDKQDVMSFRIACIYK